MDFASILADKKTFTDDIKLNINGNEVSLGDIRSLSQRNQDAVTAKMNELSGDQERTRKEYENARTLSTQAAEIISKAQAGPEKKAAPEPDGADYYDTDPLYEPIRKRLSPMEKQLAEIIESNKQNKIALERAALVFARDRWDRQYDALKPRLAGDKYKDYRGEKGVEKLAEYAASHQLLDEFGLPSVAKAVADLTREDEIAIIKKTEYERGVEAGRQAKRLASMERPASASGNTGDRKQPKLDPTQNFEDLGDVVMDDPEGRKMLSDLAELGIEDFSGVQ